MPRFSFKSLFVGVLPFAMCSSITIADTFYCEVILDGSVPPVSLKLDIFTDGSASAVLDDQSVWIQLAEEVNISSTEVFYQFRLEPKSPSERESSLELYLSRFSLKLYGRREDKFKEKVISVTELKNMQCKKEPLISVLPKRIKSSP